MEWRTATKGNATVKPSGFVKVTEFDAIRVKSMLKKQMARHPQVFSMV
jgi:hypothetical protein